MKESDAVPEPKIRVAIFSYNRPDHLANCLKSLRDLWPDADVVIYDEIGRAHV